jgi:hypothetical protein
VAFFLILPGQFTAKQSGKQMAYRDARFWETPKGHLIRFRERQKRQLRLTLGLNLQSKKSKTPEYEMEFQAQIKREMLRLRRVHPFRVPVAIQLDFTPSIEREPPSIHSLVKYYLDLIKVPEDRSKRGHNKYLVEDDRLVKALICNYWLGFDHSTPEVKIRIATMNSFVRDLQLAEQITHGERDSGFNADSKRSFRHKRDFDDALTEVAEELRDHDIHRNSFIKLMGKEAYEIHRLFLKQRQQEGILKLLELRPDGLFLLLSPYIGQKNLPQKYQELQKVIASAPKQWYSLSGIDLGAVAIREGDSDIFKTNVRKQLAAFRENKKILFPLLAPIGITILFVPPESEQVRDLDNLARRIVPVIHDELRPPSTITHSAAAFNAIAPSSNEWTAQLNKELAELRRIPKYQITQFQVFELKRSRHDPRDGCVYVQIHGGLLPFGLWHDAEEIIRAWQDDLGSSF